MHTARFTSQLIQHGWKWSREKFFQLFSLVPMPCHVVCFDSCCHTETESHFVIHARLSNNEVQRQGKCETRFCHYQKLARESQPRVDLSWFHHIALPFVDWMWWQHTLVISSQSSHFNYALLLPFSTSYRSTSRALSAACMDMAWNVLRVWLCKKSNLSYQ